MDARDSDEGDKTEEEEDLSAGLELADNRKVVVEDLVYIDDL